MSVTTTPQDAPLGAHPQTRLRAIDRRLLRSFDDPRPLTATLAELRGAAVDYGYRARRLGLRPEQLVIALKQLLTAHVADAFEPQVFDDEETPNAPVTTTKYGRVLAWSLDGYFAGATARAQADSS